MRMKKYLASMCTSCFAVALGKSGYRNVTPHCAVKGFSPRFFLFSKDIWKSLFFEAFLRYRTSSHQNMQLESYIYIDTNGDVTVVKSVTGNLLTSVLSKALMIWYTLMYRYLVDIPWPSEAFRWSHNIYLFGKSGKFQICVKLFQKDEK